MGGLRGFKFAPRMVAAVLKDCGWSGPPAVSEALGIHLSARAWKYSTRRYQVRRRNGRLGFRKVPVEQVRRLLEANSNETCRLKVGRKRGLSGQESGPPTKIARSLTCSLDTAYNSCPAIYKAVGAETFRRWVRTDHFEFGGRAAKLDMCDICNHWDRSVLRLILRSLRTWRSQLEDKMPTYFCRFDTLANSTFTLHDFQQASLPLLKAFREHVESQGVLRAQTGGEGLSMQLRLDLHTLEASILHEMKTDWSAIEYRAGLLQVAEWHAFHWSLVRVCKDEYRVDMDAPKPKTLFVHIDFAESHRLPVGPANSGSWWYAGNILQVNVLSAYVWGADCGTVVYTYLSDVLDHTCRYVIACLQDLLDSSLRVQQQVGYDELVLWCDCGTHFRGAMFMAWWLHTLPQKRKVRTCMKLFPPGHGKGRADGHFGRMRGWRDDAACKQEISTIAEYAEALQVELGMWVDDFG